MLKGFHASGWFLTDVTIICIGFNRQITGINYSQYIIKLLTSYILSFVTFTITTQHFSMYFTLIAQFTDEYLKTLDKSAEQFSVITLLVSLNHNFNVNKKSNFSQKCLEDTSIHTISWWSQTLTTL